MIEITLKQPEDFLKVKETLTRMGIANNKDKVLYQSCHILQKQGRYYIVHFKEMLKLDGRPVTIDLKMKFVETQSHNCSLTGVY